MVCPGFAAISALEKMERRSEGRVTADTRGRRTKTNFASALTTGSTPSLRDGSPFDLCGFGYWVTPKDFPAERW
jgi:hypothetical protein